ncbi:MAG TPA: RHS repeat-associated core domain-containing protein [Trueperaceae bacterium]
MGYSFIVYHRIRYYDPGIGRFTQEDPIGIAGGLNLYGYAAGDPVNFSDPFGLCPEYAGGDGRTDTADDCPREVLDAWAEQHITLGPGASWDDVDPILRDAVIKGSIQLNRDFYISTTTNGRHSPQSAHYDGNAVDISRIDGQRFSLMDDQTAFRLGPAVGAAVASFIPNNRLREIIGPEFAVRFHRAPWPYGQRLTNLINAHRDHVHVSILP